MKPSRWPLVVIALLTLLVALFWPKLMASRPVRWEAAHIGMERAAIHNAVGPPTGGDSAEEQMERWASDSPLVYRTMLVWYSDPTRPTTATEVCVLSHWHFGIEVQERLEQAATK